MISKRIKMIIAGAVASLSAGIIALIDSSSMSARKVNKKGLDLIKSFEGCKLTSYLCPAGVWTIGYGHTYGVKEGQTITQAQAESLLKSDLSKYENGVVEAIKGSEINENQFSALVSFAYNCGVGALKKSTLLKKLLINPEDTTIRDEFMKYVNGGGKVLPGLQRRRTAEADLYFS